MKQRAFFSVILLAASVSVSSAGTINKGVWTPTGCGAEPKTPAVALGTVDAFNKAVKVINDWQKKVADYNACVVNEANQDNAAIASSANAQQQKLQDAVNKLHADVDAAKAKLEQTSGSAPAAPAPAPAPAAPAPAPK